MKIIVVAMGRSGGYGLGEWISLELNYKYYHEPIRQNLIISEENRVIKYLLDEWNIMDIKPEYDVLIGLVRENSKECSISQIKGNETGKYRVKYEVSEEWLKINQENIERESLNIDKLRNKVIELQTDLLVTYERIYETGIDIKPLCELFSIRAPKYLHLLSNSNRLRKTKGMSKKPLI